MMQTKWPWPVWRNQIIEQQNKESLFDLSLTEWFRKAIVSLKTHSTVKTLNFLINFIVGLSNFDYFCFRKVLVLPVYFCIVISILVAICFGGINIFKNELFNCMEKCEQVMSYFYFLLKFYVFSFQRCKHLCTYSQELFDLFNLIQRFPNFIFICTCQTHFSTLQFLNSLIQKITSQT